AYVLQSGTRERYVSPGCDTVWRASGYQEGDSGVMVSAAESIGSAGFIDEYLAEFEPMALDKLGSSQTLTLTLPSMRSGGSPAGPGVAIAGPWEVTLQITPQLGRSITFDQALVVHDGVAMQPLQQQLIDERFGFRRNRLPDWMFHELSPIVYTREFGLRRVNMAVLDHMIRSASWTDWHPLFLTSRLPAILHYYPLTTP
ncbi:MAG TPA: hypothetical protein VF510_05145, partial [Ktedonobacterales bacterium]